MTLTNEKIISVYLVDDELLALKRLSKLLSAINSIKIIGSTTDPQAALEFLQREKVDILFLDIQMPGLNGFELLAKLPSQPMIIFTTAYNKYALKAFETNSLDYLLKPVNPEHLERALTKFSQFRQTAEMGEIKKQFQTIFPELAEKFSPSPPGLPNRISFRLGKRIFFLELDKITHFYSEDKVVFAVTDESKKHIVDYTMSELESRLNSKGFVRIHRAALVNLSFISDLCYWFGGRMRVRLKDKNQTELTVARNQVRILKERLGL